MKYLILIILWLLYLQYGFSNSNSTLLTTDSIYKENEKIIHRLTEKLISTQEFDCVVTDEFPHIKSILSENELVRVLTWCFQDTLKRYHYSGLILVKPSKKSSIFQIYILNDSHLQLDSKYLETEILSPNKWLGAQYIEIITVKNSKQNTYYLLGIEKIDDKSMRRIVEPLIIKDRLLQFGTPHFKRKHKTTVRYIFEYSTAASMQMNFNAKTNSIEYTYNVPPDPNAQLSSPFLPDQRYNALTFYKGEWFLVDMLKQYNPNFSNTRNTYKKHQNKQFWVSPP